MLKLPNVDIEKIIKDLHPVEDVAANNIHYNLFIKQLLNIITPSYKTSGYSFDFYNVVSITINTNFSQIKVLYIIFEYDYECFRVLKYSRPDN